MQSPRLFPLYLYDLHKINTYDAYIRRTFLLPNYSHPSRNFFDTYAIFYTKRAALLKVEPPVLKVESNTAKVEKKNKFNLDFLNKIR